MNPSHTDTSAQPSLYAIRVSGHLDQRWAEWFEGLTLTRDADGTSCLTGLLPDQAALHGVFYKIRDLGLPILSVQLINSQACGERP